MQATTQRGGASMGKGAQGLSVTPPPRTRGGKFVGVDEEEVATRISGGRGRRMTQSQFQPLSQSAWKKVQVVYYLTRNGLLEHPHFLEISHSPNLPLRLHDVLDRLAVLRGRAMPCSYSWSCKRSYKNGYVWNDLSENDIVCPSHANECVLKGSELLLPAPPPSAIPQERLMLPQLPTGGYREKKHQSMSGSSGHHVLVDQVHSAANHQILEEGGENDDECDQNEKASSTSSTTLLSGCSRGVSTDAPSTTSAEENATPIPLKAVAAVPQDQHGRRLGNHHATSKVFELPDSPVVLHSGRDSSSSSSLLLQLISCGGSVVARGRKPLSIPCLTQQVSLHNHHHRRPPYIQYSTPTAFVSQAATAASTSNVRKEKDDEDKVIIRYMSENPRFGNLQSEDKEYFSGSILEAINKDIHNHDHDCNGAVATEPVLKKSSSYNEERSLKARLESEAASNEAAAARGGGGQEKGKKEKEAVKVKCIPRRKHNNSSSLHTDHQKGFTPRKLYDVPS